MTSAVATVDLFARMSIAMYDHDPGATSAVICSPDGGTTKRVVDLSLYSGFAVTASNQVLAGSGMTKLEIVAADDTAMSTNLTVIKDSGTIATDAMDDYAALECSAEEVAAIAKAAGTSLRYAAARITQQNSGDEARVVYILFRPRNKHAALTATYIS